MLFSGSFLTVLVFVNNLDVTTTSEIDKNGYVTFCPCMGRLGNQVDQYLSVMAFAKALDRTFLLPAFMDAQDMVPFSRYFSVDAVTQFVRAIPLETFMTELAPTVWPPGKRPAFCFEYLRQMDGAPDDKGCNAQNSYPFNIFWNNYGIDFTDSQIYEPLSHDTDTPGFKKQWDTRYPASKFPVLVFSYAPADFPVAKANTGLQRYLVWSSSISTAADKLITENFGDKPFVGVHLRTGYDWYHVCQHLAGDYRGQMMGSPQCLGHNREHGHLYSELCYPDQSLILKQVRRALKKANTKHLFVASDNHTMIEVFKKHISKVNVVSQGGVEPSPQLDLAVLGRASHFIGNCISTFTAIAKRERDAKGLSSEFWGFPRSILDKHTEL